MLVPFLGKAFNIDDPLFLWVAQQITRDPLQFFNFNVNWYSHSMPMYEITKNPPFASFYIAAVASIFGWSEVALHSAFLLPAIAAVLGTYELAVMTCPRPGLAAISLLCTPVFLVCSTSIMCDTMMLAFWLWALVLWKIGLREKEPVLLLAAGLLAAVCALTKYFGMCLIPLMLLSALMQRRSWVWWLPAVVIPIVILTFYQLWTKASYSVGLLSSAADYAVDAKAIGGRKLLQNFVVGLSFTGGCILPTGICAGALWKAHRVALYLAATILLWVAIENIRELASLLNNVQGPWSWLGPWQLAAFVVCGGLVLILSVEELVNDPSSETVQLFLWITGTFLFAAFINWTVNGRSVLPMAPAVGILLARRVSSIREGLHRCITLYIPLAAAAVIALMVTAADCRLADSARTAADDTAQIVAGYPGKVWFEGHWGFQYYIQQHNASPLDIYSMRLHLGDAMIIPTNTANLVPLPSNLFSIQSEIRLQPNPILSTVCSSIGAGFYAAEFGPMPFAFGPVSADTYQVAVFNSAPVHNR